jgi:dihydroorotate dehydrogenase
LVFRGLALVGEIKRTIVAALERDGAQNLADYVGADAAAVTAEAWPDGLIRD